MMITCRGIDKSYGKLQVLKSIDLDIEKGEVVAMVGPSGAGKSTLLHIAGTLDTPDRGVIELAGQNPFKLSARNLAAFRNEHIGFIFQFHHLLPEFTAVENVCIPAFIRNTDKDEAETRAKELLDMLGLGHRFDHKPSELSGGEQQRVAVARALMNKPYVILADEPSGNLDTQNAQELHSLFFELRDRYEQTFLIVTHNRELARMADRQILMRDGRIVDEIEQ